MDTYTLKLDKMHALRYADNAWNRHRGRSKIELIKDNNQYYMCYVSEHSDLIIVCMDPSTPTKKPKFQANVVLKDEYGNERNVVFKRITMKDPTNEADIDRFTEEVSDAVSAAVAAFYNKDKPQRNADGFIHLHRRNPPDASRKSYRVRTYYGNDVLEDVIQVYAYNIDKDDDFGIAIIKQISMEADRVENKYLYKKYKWSCDFELDGVLDWKNATDITKFLLDHEVSDNVITYIVENIQHEYYIARDADIDNNEFIPF